MQIQFVLIMAFWTMISSGSTVQSPNEADRTHLTISETLDVLEARINAVDDAKFVDAADKASLLALTTGLRTIIAAVDKDFENVTLGEFRLFREIVLNAAVQMGRIRFQLSRVRSANRNFLLLLARASYRVGINAFIRFTLPPFINSSLRAAQRFKTAGTTEATAANTILFDIVDKMGEIGTAAVTLITSETPDLQGTTTTVRATNAEIATKITELKTAINAIG